MPSTRMRAPLLPCLLVSAGAAAAVAAAFQLAGSAAPALPAADTPAAIARLERRLHDLERGLALAAESRPLPAAVTRVAEERGLEFDEAWNAYFDSIVSRLDRIEERLEMITSGSIVEPAEALLAQLGMSQPGTVTFGPRVSLQVAGGDPGSLLAWNLPQTGGAAPWLYFVNQGSGRFSAVARSQWLESALAQRQQAVLRDLFRGAAAQQPEPGPEPEEDPTAGDR